MASGTEYAQEYQRAQIAYMNGSYDDAAGIVDRLVEEFPNDPSASLLRGHIYCYGLQQYAIAREQYEAVLQLTNDPDFTSYANQGLQHIQDNADNAAAYVGGDYAAADANGDASFDSFDDVAFDDPVSFDEQSFDSGFEQPTFNNDELNGGADFNGNAYHAASVANSDAPSLDDMDFGNLDDDFNLNPPDFAAEPPFDDPFGSGNDAGGASDPFAFADPFAAGDAAATNGADPFVAGSDAFALPETDFSTDDYDLDAPAFAANPPAAAFDSFDSFDDDQAFAPLDLPDDDGLAAIDNGAFAPMDPVADVTHFPPDIQSTSVQGNAPMGNAQIPMTGEDETLFMGSTNLYDEAESSYGATDFAMEAESEFDEPSGGYNDSFNSAASGGQSSVGFLDEFDEFDDLGNLSDFDLSENSAGFTRPALGSEFMMPGAVTTPQDSVETSMDFSAIHDRSTIRDDEVFSLSSAADQMPAFTNLDGSAVAEPVATVEQGFLAPLENAPLATKHLIAAVAAGVPQLVPTMTL